MKGTSPGGQRRLLGAIVRPEVKPSTTQSLSPELCPPPHRGLPSAQWGQDGCSVAGEYFLPLLSEDLPDPGQPLQATAF